MMFMLGWNESIDELAMVDSVHWYGDVLRMVEGQMEKGRWRWTW